MRGCRIVQDGNPNPSGQLNGVWFAKSTGYFPSDFLGVAASDLQQLPQSLESVPCEPVLEVAHAQKPKVRMAADVNRISVFIVTFRNVAKIASSAYSISNKTCKPTFRLRRLNKQSPLRSVRVRTIAGCVF